jgi:hypothetical protein
MKISAFSSDRKISVVRHNLIPVPATCLSIILKIQSQDVEKILIMSLC